MRLDELNAITPTEYSRDRYIDRILWRLGPEVASVCDIGCGVGNLLLAMEDHFFTATGIDTSDESLAIARARIGSPKIKLEKKDAYDLDEQFDLVFLTDVLEHIQEDKKLLRFIHDNVVKKDKYLIVTVPAHSRLYSRFDRNAGHCRRYDKAPLLDMLKESGFHPISCWCYGQLIFHFIANAMLPAERKGCAALDGNDQCYLSSRTRISAIREFTGVTRLLVSRVNILHRICHALDYLLKDMSFGIGYCVLCGSR